MPLVEDNQATKEIQVMSVAYFPAFILMLDDLSVAVLKKTPRYLVPVVTWKPRWLNHALGLTTITGSQRI